MALGLLAVTLLVIVYATVAKRLSTTIITAPILFIGAGVLLSREAMIPDEIAERALHLAAEITLVVLLFIDAAQTDLKALVKHHTWPARMLIIGLPLSVGLGTLAAYPFLPGWPLVAVALLAAILAPTDAALGQAVVTNPIVPERERRSLTVESGLNDGLALPLVLLFACWTAHATSDAAPNWLLFAAKQVILGPAVGALVGWAGGRLLRVAKRADWTNESFEGVATLALAGSAYLAADLVGGNGFISAFVAGLLFGRVTDAACKFIFEFTETEGQLLSWVTFLLLGLTLVPQAIAALTLPALALILVSLLVVRPLAIWISLIGTDAAPRTRLFFGWFGPRGLATALFALLVVPQIDHELAHPLLMLAINAVWISALLHGMSAMPFAKAYAKREGSK